MKTYLLTVTALGLTLAMPASAQLLGGGGLGPVGGLTGGIGGPLGGGLERGGRLGGDTVTRARRPVEAERRRARSGNRRVDGNATGYAAMEGAAGLGERPISSPRSMSSRADLSLEQDLMRTRGAVAASRRGMRRVAATASGVQVFVPARVIAAPVAPQVAVRTYPAYGPAYYYEPGAVFVGARYVDTYVERQYQDIEESLRDTGATVERRGDDLVILFPADVTFAFDKADIRSRFYRPLDAMARTLNAYPGSDVEIVGHTDAVGSELYNLGLSERRGRSVADFFVERQVSPARLVVQAMGESEPVASNATVEGRATNRRVEMIVHPRSG